MKIGQENVDRAKAIAGRDEDGSLSVNRLDGTVIGGGAFQKPQRGGADRDNAAALGPRLVQGTSRLG